VALFGFDLSIVPDIDFAVKDASIIQSEVITNYEDYFYLITQINKTLARADPVRLFLMTVIYQLIVQRSIIDTTGKQNLIKYSREKNLENIGARWGPTRGKRLQAKKSSTILRFEVATTLAIDVIIAYNTIAQTNSGVRFATTKEGVIRAGELFIELPAECEIAGSIGNGFVAGQISDLVTSTGSFVVSVANIITSSGGYDTEDDDRYRARIWMAPESFSVAGPYGAYEYWAASANADIVDVCVYSHSVIAGQVWIYPLMAGGRLPTQIEKDQVYAICNDDYIRPLTDWVHVKDLVIVPYHIDCTYWIVDTKAIFAAEIRAGIEKAFEDYKIWQRSTVGLDINPNELTRALINAGAKRVYYRGQDPADALPWHTPYTPLSPMTGQLLREPELAIEDNSPDPASPNYGLYYGGLEQE
jgi:phage-related baseplate assembly protein